MRRLPRLSIVACALSLTASFAGGLAAEAFALNGCPHHDRVFLEGAAHSPAAGATGSRDGDHDARAGSPEDHDEHGPCRCVGICHGSAGVPIPVQPSVAVGVLESTGVLPVLSTPGRLIVALSYFLPFANGPPLVG